MTHYDTYNCGRYLLRLRVVDDTDHTVFVLFDREAAVLIGKSCAELIESSEVTLLNYPLNTNYLQCVLTTYQLLVPLRVVTITSLYFLNSLQTTEQSDFPKPISDLFGRSFLFKVYSDGRREGCFEKTFRVRGVDGDDQLLTKFQDKCRKHVSETADNVLTDSSPVNEGNDQVIDTNKSELTAVSKVCFPYEYMRST